MTNKKSVMGGHTTEQLVEAWRAAGQPAKRPVPNALKNKLDKLREVDPEEAKRIEELLATAGGGE